jgi:rod shape-determining protein MreD
MRLPAYLILVYLVVGLQIGMGDFVRVGSAGARPDLVLLAVIFIAIHAPRDAALLGAFGIGLVKDMTTLSPLGLYAIAYSLVGMFTVGTQELVYRAHPVTHVTLGFAGSLLAGGVVMIHGWIKGPPASFGEVFGSALYTALLAPIVLGALNLAKGAFSFRRRRRQQRAF